MNAPAPVTSPEAVVEAARVGLVYLTLGGAGEIGMNFYLYGCMGKWIAVECGVTFGNETTPGIDVMTADPAFLESVRKDLLAIVLTHAHEDHQGAVAHLWPRLRCPVYATGFTAGLVRTKLGEAGLEGEVELHEVPLEAEITLGPFIIRYVTVTHSIPEPNALAITTKFGTVVHTGDWKIDPDPLLGRTIDEARFRALGDAGVLAMVCDSTNVFNEGVSGSHRIRLCLSAARTGTLYLHRLTGGTRLRAGADRSGRSSSCGSRKGRCGAVLVARYPRQRAHHFRHAGPPGADRLCHGHRA